MDTGLSGWLKYGGVVAVWLISLFMVWVIAGTLCDRKIVEVKQELDVRNTASAVFYSTRWLRSHAIRRQDDADGIEQDLDAALRYSRICTRNLIQDLLTVSPTSSVEWANEFMICDQAVTFLMESGRVDQTSELSASHARLAAGWPTLEGVAKRLPPMENDEK